VPKLFEEVVLLLCEDEQSLMNFISLLLLPRLHHLVETRDQLVEAELAELAHVIPQCFSKDAAINGLGGFLDSGVCSSDDVV
jgi:hypothetical protein